jgi:signal transduction histidine kinase
MEMILRRAQLLSPTRWRLTRLRWRFAVSYMLVTVLTVLAVPTLYLAASFLFVVRSPDLPRVMAADLEAVTPQIEPYLVQTPVDQPSLHRWLTDFNTNGRVQAQGSFADLWMSGPPYGTSRMTVVDGSGRVVAASSAGAPTAAGTLLATTLTAAQQRVLRAALAGDERADELATPEVGGRSLLAVPVKTSGRVIGALVLDLDVTSTRSSYLARSTSGLLGLLLALTAVTSVIGLIFGFLVSRGLTRRLGLIAAAAGAWSRGDFRVLVRDASSDELGQLARDLNRMAEQLQSHLEDRQQLAIVEERNRLARDLHDAVKQQLFATGMRVAAAEALAERDPAAAKRHLADAGHLIEQAKQELNTLIRELRPAALGDRGLVPALRDLAASWEHSGGITIAVRAQGEQPAPLLVEQALFRMAQEALSNVARHSGATHADVRVAWEAGELVLTVTDDGHGFDAARREGERARTGVGLGSMADRVEALGGTLLVSSGGSGTRVEARIPLPVEMAASTSPRQRAAPSATTTSATPSATREATNPLDSSEKGVAR